MRNDFDWLDLMRGITEMHVKSLKFVGERVDEVKPSSCVGEHGSIMTSPAIQVLPDSPVSGNEGVGDCGKLPPGAEAAGTDAFEHRTITSPLRNEHSPDSQIPDRFGDDRFTDNILRACRNLPQHGDDEEERDAAEEGALIEASGHHDPKFESNGRY